MTQLDRRRLQRFGWLAALAVAASAVGAVGSAFALSPPMPSPQTVSGDVIWKGDLPPARPPFEVRAPDARKHCGATVPDTRLTIEPGGHPVRDTIVWLEPSGPGASAGTFAAAPVTLGYDHCAPKARVTIARVGATATLTNADPFLHNMHAYDVASGEALFNIALPKGATPTRVLDRTGLFAIRCDVHPFEVAYVFVTDARFAAVTGPDGRFSFPEVDGGGWTLHAWHGEWATDPDSKKSKAPSAPAH